MFAVAGVAPLHFHFDATEFANAAYHTACVTGRLSCSRDLYQRFWNEKYHVTPEDGKRFDEFGAIFDRLESAAGPGRQMPFMPNDFTAFTGGRIRERVVAAMASKSAAEFRKRAAAFAAPDQARKLAEILAYFEQRLRPWWIETGQPIVKQRLAGIEKQLRTSGAPELAAEVAGFLETRPASRDYYLHAVPSPYYDGEHADGTAVLNQFCVEIIHRLKPEDMGWVAVHELTHSLYEQAPQDRKDALMRQFVESGDPSAHPFYMYLNEAMATAVELVFSERNGRTLEEPYTDAYIPRLGAAIVPLVRTALAQRKSLYEGFTAPYRAAARAALGDESDGLQFRYSCIALLGTEELRSYFLDRLPLHYTVTSQDAWDRFARLDGILILRYDQIHFDAADVEMEALVRKHRGFVYIGHQGEHDTVFMLGRDDAAVKELAKLWAESKERARPGLIFAID